MKFGILTFHSALNIGAQLQAFALYSKLKSLGYTIEFINYTPKYLKTPYTFFRNSHLKNGIFSVIKQGILHLYFDTFTWIRTQIHYKKFRHKYFVISKETYKTPQELAQSEYDGFIVAYIIHSGFISGYQNRYGDNLKPPTNVYHRMTA